MAPLTPSWHQPSHPSIQKVIPSSPDQFLTKSLSTIALPPFGLYAKIAFPPCTTATEPTYATVQMGKDKHLNLNSDLVYINHSCDPSLIFDMSSLSIIAGARGLKVGDELTFFYPSTEWTMAQGFDCFCGTPQCKGFISGASAMNFAQLEGMWLNAHIRELLEEHDIGNNIKNGELKNENGNEKRHEIGNGLVDENGNTKVAANDVTEEMLRESLVLARKMVDVAQKALDSYVEGNKENALAGGLLLGTKAGKGRNGVGSREMSGEMGGDTIVV